MDYFQDFKNKFQSCGGSGQSNAEKPQQFNIRGRQIQEEKLLTEGGYGYIWRAKDVNSGEVFALKRMMCQTTERLQVAKAEMAILERLPNNPYIVKYHGGIIQPYENGKIAVFLMDLCSGGSLFELMEQKQYSKFTENELLSIGSQVSQGISAMHSLYPPMAHRDIKVENILIEGNKYKLCDFGSASSQVVDFSQIQKSQFVDYEEVFEKTTTPMYRPPEMCDPYLGYLVSDKVDVWMLGCVLFTLAYFIHPFIDGQKVGICNAAYVFPENNIYSEKFQDLIRHMLTPNPEFRPSINEVISIFSKWRQQSSIQLNEQAQEIKDRFVNEQQEMQRFNANKKPIKEFNGDIPMEELMRLANKIKLEGNSEEESFAEQRKRKVQEQQKIAMQQKQRILKQQKQAPQKQSSGQQFNSNTSNQANFGSQNQFGSSNQFGSQSQPKSQYSNQNNNNQTNWGNFAFDQQPNQQKPVAQQAGSLWETEFAKPQNQQNSNQGGWDSNWNNQNQNNNQSQQNTWDQEWNNTNQQQQQQKVQNNNNNWEQEWNSNSNTNNNQFQQQQQQTDLLDLPQQKTQSQQQNSNNNNNQVDVDDLLGLGDSASQQQPQKDVDITDLIF